MSLQPLGQPLASSAAELGGDLQTRDLTRQETATSPTTTPRRAGGLPVLWLRRFQLAVTGATMSRWTRTGVGCSSVRPVLRTPARQKLLTTEITNHPRLAASDPLGRAAATTTHKRYP